ncbi:hypothetical protein OsI_03717 [Oryza sativa Indica Group]|uniref:Uncharacterized protein n=2 Tax=Oryza sativa TaxID=4530 RepID=A2ZXS5_ORYSJ|nr:hypothetical protein OsI_03717 [Oryza sativa Indica Group]EAZ13522.1 hypothetical protein OsJ_03438 [Oryza sativa Japonica Group]
MGLIDPYFLGRLCSQDGPLKDVRYEDDMKPYPFGLYVDNLSPNPSSSTPFH